jgi:glycerol-3-phosphate dehydrogenase (NAD(P)+)
VPSVHLRRNVRQVREFIPAGVPILSATKGLEIDTGKRMSEVLSEELGAAPGNSVCALSGPNLAGEIAAGKPASTVVASGNLSAANRAQEVLNSATFRVYTNDDIVGVELGGALKNIIAIGAGICDGLGLGDNARATFMTRGLAEISRLAVAAGGSPMTLAGLAGMGDLIATCSSKLSRNHQVGERLAEGMTLPEILAAMRNVAEGVNTTAAAVQMAGRLGVEMPIAEATHAVLFDNEPVKSAIARLLGRDPTRE